MRKARSVDPHVLLLVCTLLFAAGFRLLVIDRPFQYDLEGHGCYYGIQARNYLRFAWRKTRGMPLLNAGRDARVPPVFYPDHPPLPALSIAAAYAVFGEGEWQTRLPAAAATVATVWLLYRLLARTGTRRAAVLSAALFAATPMMLYFGGLPDPLGMPLILFAILTFSAYVGFHREPSRRAWTFLAVAFLFAALSDWLAFLIVPIAVVHFVATRPRSEWWRIVLASGVAVVMFGMIYAYVTIATNQPWNWMFPHVYMHSIGTAPSSITDWVTTVMRRNRDMHTLPLLIAAGLWTLTEGLRVRTARPGATAARLVLAWGLLYVAIGRGSVYLHDWTWSLVTPGLAIAAALFLDSLLSGAERRGWPRAANGFAIALVAIFAAWTSVSAYRALYAAPTDLDFTTVQMGQAIQSAAPDPNDVAMVVGAGWGWEPQWWFYGDRPLRVKVETVADFERRFSDSTTDLTYNLVEERPARAAGLVFPTSARSTFRDLWTYLRQRYPLVSLPPAMAAKFDVFDLRVR